MSDRIDSEDYVQFLYLCPVGLLDIDSSGVVRMVNPAAVRVLGPALGGPELTSVLPVLERLAPTLAREVQSGGPPGRLSTGRLVALTDAARDTWVGLDAVRIEADRLMIVVDDATDEVRSARAESRAAMEVNDTVVQTLVAAETALDLDRIPLARDLVGAASRAARKFVGAQLDRAGGVRAGIRRESAARVLLEDG